MQLSLRAGCPFFRLKANIGAVRLEFARFDVVVEKTREHFVNHFIPQGGVFDRKYDLDAPDEVSRHPIRARQVKLRVPPILEVINAAVLEESAHDADDANVFAQVRNLRPEATNDADHQVNLHTGEGGCGKYFE